MTGKYRVVNRILAASFIGICATFYTIPFGVCVSIALFFLFNYIEGFCAEISQEHATRLHNIAKAIKDHNG